MNKKAVTHVAAFLLSDGGIKTGSKGIGVRIVGSFSHGGTKAKGTISYSFGFVIG